MILARRRRIGIIIINFILFFTVIALQTGNLIDISIKNATPMLLLSLITAFSVFNSVGVCAVVGFVSGAFIDSITIGSYCFNTIVFLVIAVGVNLIANSLFNKNLMSTVTLSLITSGFYFVLRWMCFHIGGQSVEDILGYLLDFAFPSAVYSAVFVFPFYFLYRYFSKLE